MIFWGCRGRSWHKHSSEGRGAGKGNLLGRKGRELSLMISAPQGQMEWKLTLSKHFMALSRLSCCWNPPPQPFSPNLRKEEWFFLFAVLVGRAPKFSSWLSLTCLMLWLWENYFLYFSFFLCNVGLIILNTPWIVRIKCVSTSRELRLASGT